MKTFRMKAMLFLFLLALAWTFTGLAAAEDLNHSIRAKLSGYQEVPPVFTAGTGEFIATLSQDGTSLDFSLKYSDLSGTPTASHIHFGQPGVNGGVIAFLCGGGGKPECLSSPGTVTGTITAADVVGPSSQGIGAGDFAKLLEVIRRGRAYVNIHTNLCPNGEVRGQIKGHSAKDKNNQGKSGKDTGEDTEDDQD